MKCWSAIVFLPAPWNACPVGFCCSDPYGGFHRASLFLRDC